MALSRSQSLFYQSAAKAGGSQPKSLTLVPASVRRLGDQAPPHAPRSKGDTPTVSSPSSGYTILIGPKRAIDHPRLSSVQETPCSPFSAQASACATASVAARRCASAGWPSPGWPGRTGRGRAAAPPTAGRPAGFGKAKSCILVYSYGGPSHLDIWDPKPEAPREIRGEFRPIATRVPGFTVGEHLPRLARLADRFAVIRSMTHRDNDHAIGAYLALTGYSHPRSDVLGIEPPAGPQDMPSMGSVVSRVRPARGAMFSYVTLGELRHLGHHDSLGQNAGCLGRAYDPLVVPFERPGPGTLDLECVTSVLAGADARQLAERRRLLGSVTPAGRLRPTVGMRELDGHMRKAFDLLGSPAGRDAFDLDKEPARVRERYGSSPFAQNCLRARRLVAAGVPLVTVYSFGDRDWDTHGGNFPALKDRLLPPTDRGLAALLEDLQERRAARRDARRVDERDGPHAAGQQGGGARPLVVLLLSDAGRRRRRRRPGVRLLGPERGLPLHQRGEPRRPGRHRLPQPGRRPARPRHRPAGPAAGDRHGPSGVGTAGVTRAERVSQWSVPRAKRIRSSAPIQVRGSSLLVTSQCGPLRVQDVQAKAKLVSQL